MWNPIVATTNANDINMKQIELIHTLPNVFAGQTNPRPSDVWRTTVTLQRGQLYLISADSGTGKSSLCSYIYGYRRDYSGSITFDGQDIATLTMPQWCDVRQRHIAYLPQDMRLFGELTALENVQLKNRLTGHKTRQQIDQLFEALGIADKMSSLVSRLSIGQQQRVAIIRTLCQPCDFILLDEPVSHLDEENNRIVASLVTHEARQQGAGVIATSVGYHLNIEVDHMLNL